MEIIPSDQLSLPLSPHSAETLGSGGRSKVEMVHRPSDSQEAQLTNQRNSVNPHSIDAACPPHKKNVPQQQKSDLKSAAVQNIYLLFFQEEEL